MSKQFKVFEVALNDLAAYPNHPFKVYTGKKFKALANSIVENGVLEPIIVRPKGEKFEILSGHNRVAASRSVGLKTIPAVIPRVLQLK
jgi:ParB family chromosome partitioning protein